MSNSSSKRFSSLSFLDLSYDLSSFPAFPEFTLSIASELSFNVLRISAQEPSKEAISILFASTIA